MRKIIIKTEKEIVLMREGGAILRSIRDSVAAKVVPGVSTWELNEYAETLFKKYNVIPSFKGYGGFPAAICTSVNYEVVHGIPKREVVLLEGDIIGIDLGVFHKGFHTDSAVTVPVGKIDEHKSKLIEVTRASFDHGLAQVRSGVHLSDIGAAIQKYVESHGFSVIRDLVGHGIGASIHEPPEIPNFGIPGQGPILHANMALAIEPMVTSGKYKVKTLDDQWTVVTLDRKPSAHYEHTVIVTNDGYEIIT